jgi:hypothetical protein
MRFRCLIIFFIGVISIASSQMKVWVYTHGGNTRFYNPQTMGWEPIIEKQQVPVKTYVLTSEGVQFKVFKGADVAEGPSNGYFFLDDVFPRKKIQIVEELTIIESQQLRSTSKGDSLNQKNIYGLTYGLPSTKKISDPSSTIPHFKEWENAVNWFYEQKRYDAAVLSLKRLVVQFPSLYYNIKFTDLLMKLYEKLELYGFIYSETNWLIAIQKEGDSGVTLKKWNELAKQKLTNR